MAKSKTTFKKGEGGRKPGTPNRTTVEAREFLQSILYAEFDNIQTSLQNIRENESEAKYIDSLNKMLSFILPKQTDITTGGEKINRPPIIVSCDKTKELIERLRTEK